MAKKKTEAKSETTTTKKKAAAPAAKKAEAKSTASSKASSKSSKPSTTPSPMMPMVDTNLAAAMLGAGRGRRDQNQTAEDKREGSLIRQLKADLNKGHSQTVSNVLDKGAPQGTKKSGGQPF